jgi:hypothetical protein
VGVAKIPRIVGRTLKMTSRRSGSYLRAGALELLPIRLALARKTSKTSVWVLCRMHLLQRRSALLKTRGSSMEPKGPRGLSLKRERRMRQT